MKYHLLIVITLNLLVSACTTIKPIQTGNIPQQAQHFSHQDFDQVLNQNVNDEGRIDYRSLQARPEQFERYYQKIAAISPDSSPASFNGEADRLAYWINAYNAAVIKTVLTYYPISSIEDVKPPIPLFFLPDKTGFFLFQKPTFGGVTTSLYYLENSVIRDRFPEPRVHFALNCASGGCPKLPRYAFVGDKLDDQLDDEARKFFAETRNFRIDHAHKTVFLSSILDWYHDDFTDWYQRQYPDRNATLINYVSLYVDQDKRMQLQENATDYEVQFTPYDWQLNDQNIK